MRVGLGEAVAENGRRDAMDALFSSPRCGLELPAAQIGPWVDALSTGRPVWMVDPRKRDGQGAGAHPRRDRAISGARVGPGADPLVRIGWR